MSDKLITRLQAASEVIEGASYEHPGFISITEGRVDFSFGDMYGPIDCDFGPAHDPGATRVGADWQIPKDSSVGDIVRYVHATLIEKSPLCRAINNGEVEHTPSTPPGDTPQICARCGKYIKRQDEIDGYVLDVPANNYKELQTAARRVMDLLREADPTGTPGRHPEWPLQIIADADRAEDLCEAFQDLDDALEAGRS